MTRRRMIPLLLAVCLFAWAPGEARPTRGELPEPTASDLPRWRGFNLLEKFYHSNPDRDRPFVEEDFRLIHELGFNFVRLPMDYRCWIVDGDWEQFDEKVLREIDQAVEYGKKYDIHVCINFHRAPGYTVASPKEPRSLWTDAEAQRVCALHWSTFARRYRGIPNTRLSFNLLNEPSNVDAETHLAVVRMLVKAIRKEDPDRLIICDARQWGNEPDLELADLGVALATRGYKPMEVTHYRAGWVGGAGDFPPPAWPVVQTDGLLCSPAKKDLHGPLTIAGPFPGATRLRLRVGTVSASTTLQVTADGEPVLEKQFDPGPGEGEWKKPVFEEKYNVYQNIYDRDYEAAIPAGTRTVQLKVTRGDWLNLKQVEVTDEASGQSARVFPISDWRRPPEPLDYRAPRGDRRPELRGPRTIDRQWLWENVMAPFRRAEEAGLGVMVGEFGVYNKTPHEVSLAFLEDCLKNYERAGWGWALWNFRGSFGILDSGRADVEYEDFHGHQLDRKMLELLRRY